MSHVIIIGPPGSGKGTASKQICKDYMLKHISTGDLLRATDDEEIKNLLKDGNFVSDECITKLLKKDLESNHCLLDGYPRTLNQAKILDREYKDIVSLVLLISTDDEECIRRIKGRKEHREDDQNITVTKKRLEIYHSITEPVIEYYRKKGIVEVIDGNQTKEKVYEQIRDIMEKRRNLK